METTTPDGGASAQPTTPAAVTTGYNADQVITTDEAGTPTMVPATSADASASAGEAVSEEPQAPETQATTEAADDIEAWAEKKGIDLKTADPVKLAQMVRESEKKMHEATQAARSVAPIAPPQDLPTTGDPNYDPIVERLNRSEQIQYVTSWFDANPEAKAHKGELQEIANRYPELTNMDHVYAHFLANPKRETDLKQAGATEALTNLAQKQQQIPPGANATNSGVYESQAITARNVWQQIDSHDQAWFEKNHDTISKAIAGKL